MRLIFAIVRAILTMALIATPALLLQGTNPDAAQIVTLVALFAGTMVLFEYAAEAPSIVEFRDAPPFNRMRFVTLYIMVILLTLICRGQTETTALTVAVTTAGNIVGLAIDFPYSPVRLVLAMLPEATQAGSVALIRACAGLAYLTSLLALAVFVLMIRLKGWPGRDKSFNVWINLPTFDPTAGGDVVDRLIRDARFNISLGFLLPFLIPLAVKIVTGFLDPIVVNSAQTLIWTVTAWAFLPASLFMRGIAMARIAEMIEEQRRHSSALSEEQDALVHA